MRSSKLYYVCDGFLDTKKGNFQKYFLNNPKLATWERLGEAFSETDIKKLKYYQSIFLENLRKKGYVLSDKERIIFKRLYSDTEQYEKIKGNLVFNSDNHDFESWKKWRKENEGNYSFTRFVPLNNEDLHAWYEAYKKNKQNKKDAVNPDFKYFFFVYIL